MITVLKYPVQSVEYFEIEMPMRSISLSVAVIGGAPYLFALVADDTLPENKGFSVCVTGAALSSTAYTNKYIGSYIIGGIEYHLFEGAENRTCADEKTSVAVADTTHTSLTITWVNPAGSIGTKVTYRDNQYNPFIAPNEGAHAIGSFNSDGTAFTFTSGINTDGIPYGFLIQSQCTNGIFSPGVIVEAVPT